MVQADYLFLMTDVDCLYTSNPRTNPSALPIHVVDDPSTLTADVSTAGSSLGVGGMSTKIVAARLATSAGVMTVITRSSKPGNVADIIAHVQALKQAAAPKLNDFDTAATPEAIGTTDMLPIPPLHTRFMPSLQPIRSRSFWLLHGLSPRGTLYIDEGAHRALLNKAGLLPVGIVSLEGHFSQQEAVRLVVVRQPDHAAQTQSPTADAVKAHLTSSAASISAPSLNQAGSLPPTPTRARARVASINDRAGVAPVEIGRALVNYSAAEITRIKGLQSGEILAVLGYADSEYVALRENVSLLMTSGNATPTRELGEREVGDER
jgi:glutamate 5-kinase